MLPTATTHLPRTPLKPGSIPKLDRPEVLYKKYLAKLATGLRLGDDPEGKPRLRGLAATLTMARFALNAENEFRQARNRAIEAVEAVNKLRNWKRPWPARMVVAARTAVQDLLNDELLTVWRTAMDVWQGLAGSKSPVEAWSLEFLEIIDKDGGPDQGELLLFARRIESFAIDCVGPNTSIFIDLDRVGRWILGGAREMRSAEVAQWLRWQLMEYFEAARGSRRNIGKDADFIVDTFFPALVEENQTRTAVTRYRAIRRFFSWTRGERPRGLPPAAHLGLAAGLADRFEELGLQPAPALHGA